MEIGTRTIKMNWKIRIISVIVSGIPYAGILYLFHLWDGDNEMYTMKAIIFQGIFFGLFMGIAFPYAMGKFGKRFTSSIGKNIKPELTEDEEIEIEGPTNLFRGFVATGGKIFLTNKKFIFKSHKINVQKGQTDINYDDISEIIKRKTMKLIDNGIRIKTNNGKEFDFVVNERDLWIEKLNEKIK